VAFRLIRLLHALLAQLRFSLQSAFDEGVDRAPKDLAALPFPVRCDLAAVQVLVERGAADLKRDHSLRHRGYDGPTTDAAAYSGARHFGPNR